MKVTVCPVCRITPDFTATEVKCPKCGRRAVGGDLTETLTKWNAGIVEASKAAPEPVKVVEEAVEEVKPVKETKKETKKETSAKPSIKSPKKSVKKGEK